MDAPHPALAPDESTRTTSRTSGRSNRVEIITRAEPRRSWTLAQKREIVAESFGPDLTPTEVARKYAISSGQLYTWRQQLLGVQATLVRRGGRSSRRSNWNRIRRCWPNRSRLRRRPLVHQQQRDRRA
jgi:transposase-like protein